jgi:hypothetical protein
VDFGQAPRKAFWAPEFNPIELVTDSDPFQVDHLRPVV